MEHTIKIETDISVLELDDQYYVTVDSDPNPIHFNRYYETFEFIYEFLEGRERLEEDESRVVTRRIMEDREVATGAPRDSHFAIMRARRVYVLVETEGEAVLAEINRIEGWRLIALEDVRFEVVYDLERTITTIRPWSGGPEFQIEEECDGDAV